MKRLLITILLSLYLICGHAQNTTNKYPFDLDILKHFSGAVTNDTIIPVYNHGKFYYINSVSKKNVANASFDEAYPFAGKCALIRKNGKYGIIDSKINYIIEPTFNNPYIFIYGEPVEDTTKEHLIKKIFRFDKGVFVKDTIDNGCKEPIGPQIYFIKEGKKFYYELNDGKNTRSAAKYDTASVFDPFYAIAKLSGKWGMINSKSKVTIPFIYDDFTGPASFNVSSFYALKKRNDWHYFRASKELFQTRFKPDLMFYDNVLLFKVGNLYNYFNNQGIKVLPVNYKWIYENGTIAINLKDQVVILKNNEEFVYYEPDTK